MNEKEYKGCTIRKTNFNRWEVLGTLGTYRTTEYTPTFKTLKSAKEFVDRMEKSAK